ncbi:cytochrome c oxidase assembly protein [Actinomadura sp. KC06]|nr:cytochrome c oxidase assembly protein [Actinomadura sp. KC06]
MLQHLITGIWTPLELVLGVSITVLLRAPPRGQDPRLTCALHGRHCGF